ncbi:hypothetical protein [Paractinoplanes globisporus]|uniref:Uncharacterized protein n=1 Tax=Paractinoplanes globisporus TaxID=113565 RepID=A0ABW6WHS2_9ACTN|nr:hypothetical protein [Actinoplanes globisporus]
MDTSGLPESVRARIAERTALPAIDKVRSFLHGYVADAETLDEVQLEIQDTANVNTLFLRQYLEALETILSEPTPPGTLLRLVEGDANWGIDHDQTDAGAAAFLAGLARMLRSVIEAAG